MTFPLFYLLLPYFVFLLIFLLFTLINIYHLLVFTEAGFIGFFMTFFFLAGSVYLLFLTWSWGSAIDWQQTAEVFRGGNVMPTF